MVEENKKNIPKNAIVMISEKNKPKLLKLLEAGYFKIEDVESGQININFHNGHIQNIFLNKMTYKRNAKNGRIPI